MEAISYGARERVRGSPPSTCAFVWAILPVSFAQYDSVARFSETKLRRLRLTERVAPTTFSEIALIARLVNPLCAVAIREVYFNATSFPNNALNPHALASGGSHNRVSRNPHAACVP